MSRIAITDHFNEPGKEELSVLGDLVGTEVGEDTEVLLVWHEKIDETYVSRLPNLRGVQRYGVGFDNLDVDYLNTKDIICCNNPDYGVDEVSDTALAFVMAISRGITRYDNLARGLSDSWQENILLEIKRNSDLRVGVVGAGRIGSSVLLKCHAIGFKTAFYDPYKESGHEKVLHSERYQSLGELLAVSDIVTIHCPLNAETRGMIDDEFIESMKPGASLVNTARGGILADPAVLLQHLRSGHLNSVSLDVLPEEPPGKDEFYEAWRRQEPWLAGRLLINPHTSYFSQAAQVEIRRKAAENALRIYQKIPVLNRL